MMIVLMLWLVVTVVNTNDIGDALEPFKLHLL